MCERKEDEVWIAYFIRQIKESPLVILAIIGLAAAALLYQDIHEMVISQTAANTEIVNTLKAMDARLQVLEIKMLQDSLEK